MLIWLKRLITSPEKTLDLVDFHKIYYYYLDLVKLATKYFTEHVELGYAIGLVMESPSNKKIYEEWTI